MIAPLGPDHPVTNASLYLRETLREPNLIAVDASTQRATLALNAGVLTTALDAAQSAEATGPIEKMICHQMAAVHDAGMGILGRLHEAETWVPSRMPPPGELARLTNAAARLFEVYQNGALVLQKLKTGGAQRVIVQHQQLVQVGPGGQAVVAKTVRRRSGKKRRPKESS